MGSALALPALFFQPVLLPAHSGSRPGSPSGTGLGFPHSRCYAPGPVYFPHSQYSSKPVAHATGVSRRFLRLLAR